MDPSTAGHGGNNRITRFYDDIAAWYDTWVGAGPLLADPFFGPLAPLLGDVAGLRLCDLACGQGRVSRHLASSGARVVGVDSSRELLTIARRYQAASPDGVAYLRADAQDLRAVQDAVFDGVICHMALMDIPDLTATLGATARVLRPGGWLAFSVLHPCFNTPTSGEGVDRHGALCRTINGYWDEGYWRVDDRPGPPGQLGAYHRTLGTYINAAIEVGLTVDRVVEPTAPPNLAERRPIWREVPAALIVRCGKSAATIEAAIAR